MCTFLAFCRVEAVPFPCAFPFDYVYAFAWTYLLTRFNFISPDNILTFFLRFSLPGSVVGALTNLWNQVRKTKINANVVGGKLSQVVIVFGVQIELYQVPTLFID